MNKASSLTAKAQLPELPPLPGSRPARGAAWLNRAAVLVFLAALFLPGWYYAHDKYMLPEFTRYMALALFAMSVDLVWGYTGLLSLGQGLYFGLGAYAVAYSLKLQAAAIENNKPMVAAPDMALPDFMSWTRLGEVPVWIRPLIDLRVAIPLAIIVPTVLATLFGYITFRRRIKGVFFSLVTQALLLAVFTVVYNQQPYTGGVVGMNNLAKLQLFGHKFVGLSMYLLTTAVTVICFLGCAALIGSKFGKILTAIRDSEYRVLALGYNTAMYKTFVFALAGGLAGLAGALYVSSLGTAGPDRFGISFSIEIIVFVAVGGRGTLVGAILGALLVSWANTYINDAAKDKWPFVLGGLFILVTVFLPEGIVGGIKKLAGLLRRQRAEKKKLTPLMVEGI
jgi:urea transport system permease protein